MKVPHIVTTGYNAQMVGSDTVGGVQTWCGQFQTWHSEEQRQTYYDRRDNSEREYGEGLWWYGCSGHASPCFCFTVVKLFRFSLQIKEVGETAPDRI